MFPEMLINSNYAYEGDNPADKPYLHGQAMSLFSTMMTNGMLHRVSNMLKRRSKRLLDQTSYQSATCIPNRHYAGLKIIPIDRIRGSEGRTEDFDDAFYPLHDRLRNRWLNVASVRLAGEGLPPVELIHNSGVYFVRDGHHRISVARALGEAYIDAEVIDVTC